VRNHSRGLENSRFFEVGPQYTNKGQHRMASGLAYAATGPRHWLSQPRPVDIYDAKAHVFALFASLGMNESSFQIEATAPSYYHPGRSGTIKQGPRVLAHFGEIHPKMSQHFETTDRMVAFEVFLDNLPDAKMKKSALILSPYQPVVRDFAFLVDSSLSVDHLIKAIQKIDRALITSVEVFDLYQGDKVPAGKKSVALAVRLEPQQKTLTDEEIQTVSAKIIAQVEKTSGGSLRAS
jgi:phenylalanyl-tRNA synthetase beta chain